MHGIDLHTYQTHTRLKLTDLSIHTGDLISRDPKLRDVFDMIAKGTVEVPSDKKGKPKVNEGDLQSQ